MKYDLAGVDGNAFCVMGYVVSAMRREGKSKNEIDEYQKNATSSDYNHLLAISIKMISKLNKEVGNENE